MGAPRQVSRTRKSILNTAVSFGSQFIIILLGFISRRILIYSVGVEYLGINALMTNILTILSLAESGIGVAIGYALYKPLAENNVEEIKTLMRFFRNIYRCLAVFTIIVGLIFYPFLPIFLTGYDNGDADLIYFLFLFSSAVSYLWVYKTTLNSSNQNKYIYTIFNTVTQVLTLVLKILILYFTENYIIFLVVDIATTVIKNAIFSFMMNRWYPYLKDKDVKKIEGEIKERLFSNIRALFLGKVGYILKQCSDTLITSSLVSIVTVGMYSNYTVLVTSVQGFVSTFTSGVTASMGNLVTTSNKKYVYSVYKRIDFINFWLFTFTGICLLCLIEPFISLWLGSDYIMDRGVLVLAVIIYFLQGINSAVDVIKNASGLFRPDRWVPIIESTINIAISIVLAIPFGLIGVLIGTLVSFILCSFWTKPFFVYRQVFERPFREYILFEGKKVVAAVAIASIVFLLQSLIVIDSLPVLFLIRLAICVLLPNLLLALIYFHTDEFAYIKDFTGSIIKRLKK